MAKKLKEVLDYKKLNIISKNKCPYFTGVEEHGSEAIIDLEFDTYEYLQKKHKLDWFDGEWEQVSLHVYEDNTILFTTLSYSYYHEEWRDCIEYTFEDNTEIQKDIDRMLSLQPIADRHGLFINSFDELMKNIRKNKTLVML